MIMWIILNKPKAKKKILLINNTSIYNVVFLSQLNKI
jgi:hypothetical protein